jgi:hypothetical protein
MGEVCELVVEGSTGGTPVPLEEGLILMVKRKYVEARTSEKK